MSTSCGAFSEVEAEAEALSSFLMAGVVPFFVTLTYEGCSFPALGFLEVLSTTGFRELVVLGENDVERTVIVLSRGPGEANELCSLEAAGGALSKDLLRLRLVVFCGLSSGTDFFTYLRD